MRIYNYHYDFRQKKVVAATNMQGVRERVSMIGKLDDRRKIYLAAGNRLALLALSAEYRALNMPAMAKEIKVEAEGLR